MIRWSKEHENYLREIYKGKLNREIADEINKKFGTRYTSIAISSKKTKLKLKSNVDISLRMQIYDKSIMDYIFINYKGKSSIELANEINKKFNLNISNDKLQNIKSNMRRRYGYIFTEKARNDGCIKKGNIPMNKGKKWDEYMSKEGQTNSRKTCFKKGNIPQNYRPLGSERINVDGFIEVKVSDPNKWITKNRLVWEQHYGKIPKGHKVIYLDGDKQNNDISNLKLITDAEELIMNHIKLRYTKKELTETGYLIAKIMHKRNEKK